MHRYFSKFYDVDYTKKKLPGHFFDLYDVDYEEEILGKGAFGTVRRCIEKRTGLEFAVKIVEKRSGKEWQDVLYEAEILRKLKHPHIVVLHNHFQGRKHLYLVFDLVNGGELYHDIVTRKTYSEADASNSMKQILEGIEYCHRKGVIHSDLKPKNILLASKVRGAPIKIADFGLAFEVTGDQRKWYGGAGTPTHMSPEIYNREPYGKPTDIWSLYTLLVGDIPFDHDDDEELYALIKTGDYYHLHVLSFLYPSQVRDTISAEAKHLIRQMLNVDQYKRFTAAQALKHPWIYDRKRLVPKNHLPETVVNLKKFNARRKFKAGFLAAMVAITFLKKPQTKKYDALVRNISTDSETVKRNHKLLHRKRRSQNITSSTPKKSKMET